MAKKLLNPLFDEPNITPQATTASTPVTASMNSPITGRPMMEAFCGETPVMVDLENRVVFPRLK